MSNRMASNRVCCWHFNAGVVGGVGARGHCPNNNNNCSTRGQLPDLWPVDKYHRDQWHKCRTIIATTPSTYNYNMCAHIVYAAMAALAAANARNHFHRQIDFIFCSSPWPHVHSSASQVPFVVHAYFSGAMQTQTQTVHQRPIARHYRSARKILIP